ncbi:ABC transporter substrate-binding protein [Paraburkholderia terricola]|uniref:NitT/TauT family transport system substrate-binding protein n=1 Tax=Paraburkholderia terricola TaxID=169427 RepID=A0ABU1LU89_9BURK|nr:ABC transporter substrate-binding protein [Paraburkholderia terricola]MDR6410239.1 NitT/TauT family transport system substrate-binding protein [Paraburkholderia terricola]MDR6481399.1 NitT/TauT family transport system substrate-binding protein [Paraburkholderia terricola]
MRNASLSFSRAFHAAVAAFFTLFLLAPAAASAQDDAPGKVAIMVGGITKLIYLPVYLTEQLGYFKAEGLDVELLSQTAGVDAENELLAGAVQGVVGFYDHTIVLQSKGKEVKSIVVLGQVPGEVEMVSARAADSIKSMADVRGKTLGVTGLGSSTNFLTQYLARLEGVPNSQYTVLPVGADNSFIAAIRQGRIDAGMTTEPTVSQLLKSGDARILVDMRNVEGTRAALGGTYPASSLYVQSAWLDTHPREAAKLARAFVRTLQYLHTHSAEEIAARMPKNFIGNDKALYVSALKASLPMFTVDGRMPADGPRTVLKVLSGFNPSVKGRHVDLSRTFTNQFVDEVKP